MRKNEKIVIVKLDDGSYMEVTQRCANCAFITCKKSNNCRFTCSKHGPKNLNNRCNDFIISDVLIEILKNSEKPSISNIIKVTE